MPDTAIKESSKRILTSLKNAGFRLPAKQITVNLAPADLKKEGTLFDLPIAVGILMANQFLEVPKEFLQETFFWANFRSMAAFVLLKVHLPLPMMHKN